MLKTVIEGARVSQFALLLSPTFWLFVCIWTAFIAGYGHHAGSESGRDAERALWLKQEGARKDAMIAAVAADTASRAAIQAKQNQTNVKVSTAHENEIEQGRTGAIADRAAADRAGGLRIPAPARRDCHAPTTQAANAVELDEEAAPTVRLPREVEDDLWAAYEEADALSAQIRAMQDWALANGFYGTTEP